MTLPSAIPTRLAPVLLATAALLVGAFAAGTVQSADAAAKRTCSPKGSKTVQSNTVARLYVRPGSEGGIADKRLFGCALSTKRPVFLAAYGGYAPDGYISDLRGRIVAVNYTFTDPADMRYGYLRVWDLNKEKPFFDLDEADATDLELGPKRSFAWIGSIIDNENDGAPLGVRIHDSRGDRTLATGGVAPGSLAIAGKTVYWTQNGTPKSAKLVP